MACLAVIANVGGRRSSSFTRKITGATGEGRGRPAAGSDGVVRASAAAAGDGPLARTAKVTSPARLSPGLRIRRHGGRLGSEPCGLFIENREVRDDEVELAILVRLERRG